MTDKQLIDELLPKMYELHPYPIELFTVIAEIKGITNMIEKNTFGHRINDRLIHEGIANEKGKITPLGLDIIEKHNGYINFLTAKKLDDQKEKSCISKADKLQSNSLILSNWTKWTYWLGFIFGVIALIVSIKQCTNGQAHKDRLSTLQAKVDTLSLEISVSKKLLDSLKNTKINHGTTLDTTSRQQ